MPFVKSTFSIPLEHLQRDQQHSSEEKGHSFRPMCLRCGVFGTTRGSAYVEFGRTRVLAQVYGPKEDGTGDFHSGTIAVSIKGAEEEKFRAQLESALSGTVQLYKYAKSQITVELSVLSSDGGILQASLMAATLAIIHAGIEVLDVCVACHISVSSLGDYCVDPSAETAKNQSHVTVGLLPNLNQIVCCDVRGALSLNQSSKAITFALDKAVRLYPVVRKAVLAGLT